MDKLIQENIRRRKNMVQIAYRFFILSCDIARIKQDILDDEQIQKMDDREEQDLSNMINYVPIAIEDISKFLVEDWRWERIPKMIQAILCVAVYEMKEIKQAPAVVIDSCIELTRDYLPSWDEKFVNAILDKVAKEETTNE